MHVGWRTTAQLIMDFSGKLMTNPLSKKQWKMP
jgi:hypothetical protein